jgi:hypothetical protein
MGADVNGASAMYPPASTTAATERVIPHTMSRVFSCFCAATCAGGAAGPARFFIPGTGTSSPHDGQRTTASVGLATKKTQPQEQVRGTRAIQRLYVGGGVICLDSDKRSDPRTFL